ncbi:glycosyltransferase [Thiohalobacter thiocyanaticus]|uniref:Glycosyltransferase n=1 Tax=Thiohalobacter thiocyanaticus TaxID=585455 RepID=A0A426QKX7_9GAMM|nr:glycosyltransferase [Thiohalobacter thiocyanaticus]RRQ22412.1 glycosyltransferase [Thiohalobacter thiocyanaticus]
MPCISILLPVRNGAATLAEALDSIARQSFTDYELIAVNDASDDATVALLQQYRAQDQRLRILDNPRPGLVNALNLGLGEAGGELVARMDADDRMHPQRLQRQRDWLQAHPGYDVVGCRVALFPVEAVRSGMRHYVDWLNRCLSPEQIHQDIYLESPLAHPSVMFRRRTVLAHGGYRDGDFPEDYELWLRLHQQGLRFGKVDEILLDWREHPERVSRRDPRCTRAAFDRIRAQYLSRDPLLRQQRPLAIWGAGRKTRRRVRPLLELGHRPDAWIDIDPRKLGQRLDGVPVQPPAWILEQPVRPLVFIYVASHGAREDIAAWLQTHGLQPGQDYYQVG